MSNPTASIIIIGNEILSGRVVDINTQFIAQKLSFFGINLLEVRTILDNREAIISCVKELHTKYDYIFTTGGIGPTHDDITSEAVASAFGLKLELNRNAYDAVKEFYQSKNQGLNAAQEKMAYVPKGAELIDNPISKAPGFILKNVYVLPGVPSTMQAMFDNIAGRLSCGKQILSKTCEVMIGESSIAAEFMALQNKFPEINMGSYPFELNGKYGTNLVLSATDPELLNHVYNELLVILDGMKIPHKQLS